MLYWDQNSCLCPFYSIPHSHIPVIYTSVTSKLFEIFQISFKGQMHWSKELCTLLVHLLPTCIFLPSVPFKQLSPSCQGPWHPFWPKNKREENKIRSADHHITFPLVPLCLTDGGDLSPQQRLELQQRRDCIAHSTLLREPTLALQNPWQNPIVRACVKDIWCAVPLLACSDSERQWLWSSVSIAVLLKESPRSKNIAGWKGDAPCIWPWKVKGPF